ncbi:hypothetical protein JOQ06_016728, partial [Pogonophryne albipinna]
ATAVLSPGSLASFLHNPPGLCLNTMLNLFTSSAKEKRDRQSMGDKVTNCPYTHSLSEVMVRLLGSQAQSLTSPCHSIRRAMFAFVIINIKYVQRQIFGFGDLEVPGIPTPWPSGETSFFTQTQWEDERMGRIQWREALKDSTAAKEKQQKHPLLNLRRGGAPATDWRQERRAAH